MECSSAYEFAFRGLLTEEALDRAGRRPRDVSGVLDQDIADKLSLTLLDDDLVAAARRMENSGRMRSTICEVETESACFVKKYPSGSGVV